MGFGISHDGLHWEALPSPRMEPPTVHWSEVGAVEYSRYRNGTAGAYFAMLGGNARNQLAEMVTYVAQRPEGPFVAASKNFVVLPTPSCYFARFFRGRDGELLVTHQSFSAEGTAYLAPYKAVSIDDEGTLRLAYWPANDHLKGPSVPVAWADGFLSPPLNASAGFVLEATLSLPPAATGPNEWPGFVIESAAGANSTLVAVDGAARAVVANVSDARSAARPAVLHTWDRELAPRPAGAAVTARLLYRRGMLELYVEDVLLALFLAPAPATGRVALVTGAAAKRVSALRRWTMSLEY